VASVRNLSDKPFYFSSVAAGQGLVTEVPPRQTINDGTVVGLPQTGTYALQTKYTILTAGTAVTGTFAGATSSLAFLTPVLSYDAKDVYLTLVRAVNFGEVVRGGNAGAVARDR
jgi:hypothetical protein